MSNEAPPGQDSASPTPEKVCPTCGSTYGFDMLFCPRDASRLIPKSTDSDLVGQIIAERYHILRKLGEGGMGRVYLAEHVAMSRMCAIKVMHSALRSDTEAVTRFRREAANAGRINHPNVAAMYDSGETADKLIYLAMEYVPGDSLGTLMKWESPLPVRRAVGVAVDVANALSAAHKLGIVHRDLKPDNIIVARSKDGHDLAKVVDFGIAKATQAESQTVTRVGFAVGTIQYMSPEQMMAERVDVRSDIYSLGCILYEMLAGKRMFEGSTGEVMITQRLTQPPPRPRQANPNVPKALDDIVVKMLARSPNDRFQSADELIEALTKVRLESPVPVGRRLITPWRGFAAGQAEKSASASGERPAAGGSGEKAVGSASGEKRVASGERPGAAAQGAGVASSGEAAAVGVGLDAADAPALSSRTALVAGGAVLAALAIVAIVLLDGGSASPDGTVQPNAPVSGLTTSAPGLDGGLTGSSPTATGQTSDPGTTAATPANPAPVVTELSPTQGVAGAAGSLQVTVRGRDFVPGSVALWNGATRPTTYVSATELRVEIPASDLRQATRSQLTVRNPAPGGGDSGALAFTVTAPPTQQTTTTAAQTGGGGATRTAAPAPPPAPPPAPRPPAEPPAAELGAVRGLLTSATASGSDADFPSAFGTLANAERQIAALQNSYPASEQVRALGSEHAAALTTVRNACQTVTEVRRTLGTEPPNCAYPQ